MVMCWYLDQTVKVIVLLRLRDLEKKKKKAGRPGRMMI